ncbi:MAG: ribose 5-phosphate isomerase B [Chlorobi bacterium]|nr:ribose 5-phosphate isomerase B [Chlorobiota bacterium]
MKSLKIALACDHAGYKIKEKIKEYLIKAGHNVKDFGTNSEESVDYPDFAHPLARAVENNEYNFGITLCGSGNGISMTANKHQGIRAALCWNVEIAKLARLHNNANVCSIPARFVSPELAIEIVNEFLITGFEGGRHIRRLKKMPVIK